MTKRKLPPVWVVLNPEGDVHIRYVSLRYVVTANGYKLVKYVPASAVREAVNRERERLARDTKWIVRVLEICFGHRGIEGKHAAGIARVIAGAIRRGGKP